ncbi:MAG: sigma-54 interaction domain-containing protein [Anaerovoracaceae bacterium]|nr:sigma-54 dependent transcriptional regulator [Bacillota bacterium]MDY5770380.1 sigma-54 dependent transcriptional regulator [Anaerovoracaceae bacterium]
MSNNYGLERVLEPKYVLPTSAWKLDNSRNIYPNEMLLSIKRIHLEGTSFKQICTEVNYNEEKIKQTIIDIVIRRGKLHNPVTDTGGLIFGQVEKIGESFESQGGVKAGDEIICNASLASVPIYIEKITAIDYAFNQIEVEGYAVVHDRIPLVKVKPGIPLNLLLFTLDESGTLFSLNKLAEGKVKCLIVGNNMITNLIFGYVLRRKLGPEGEITCLLDRKTGIQITGGGIDRLVSLVFNQIHYLDILKPVECLEKLNAESLFDLSVNCAEIPGAETVNILATRPGGTVLFANLINNLNIALYITESISKTLEVHGAQGYIEGYDDFDVQIVSEIAAYFENASFVKIETDEPEEYINPYNRSLIEKTKTEDFVFNSKAMKNVLDEILKVSRYDCNVIIFGDTGVGKEKVANLIQKNSDRKMQPFVKINCGAISPSLIESEFFGYEKGAFTGANASGKKGYFELANNGVMFLDEIGELPLDMQAKLLRVIQDGEFYRVGGTTPVKTNVRIISATNRDLEKLVEEGKFRRDLYYRLNVVPIRIPRLGDRPEDIPVLVNHFLGKYGEKFGTSRKISESAMDYLKKLPWPGNIRELENSVQRLIISSKGEDITLMDVMRETHGEIFGGPFMGIDEDEETGQEMDREIDLQTAVDEYEKGLIKHACEKYGSTRKAAKAIGISQTQLVRKKKKYGI